MNKGKLYYVIDILLALSLILVLITGIIKWPGLTYLFRPVYRIIKARYLVTIHDWAGVAMAVFVLIHLALHWKWLVVMTKKVFEKRKK